MSHEKCTSAAGQNWAIPGVSPKYPGTHDRRIGVSGQGWVGHVCNFGVLLVRISHSTEYIALLFSPHLCRSRDLLFRTSSFRRMSLSVME